MVATEQKFRLIIENMKTNFALQICFTALLLSGCVSQTVKTPTEDALWRYDTKAQITDKVKNDSHTVSIEIFSYRKQNYRLEVNATLGYGVASVTMNTTGDRNGVQYLLYPQKSFIKGPLGPKAFRPLFKQDLDPRLLIDLIEDRALKKYDFLCGRQTELVIKCTNDDLELILERPPKDDDSFIKKFTIDSKTFRMVWVFKGREFNNGPTNETLAKTFVLEKPEGFKQVDIK